MSDNNGDQGREEQSRGESSQGTTESSGPTGNAGQASSNILQSAISHYASNKTDALLMFTRFLTILFSLLYMIPMHGSGAFYKKVLIANAATSALRLHQRLPRFQLTAEFLNQLIAEDSCHYLLFSIIFLGCHPITLVLLPISLFATLHVAFSALTLLDKTGNRSTTTGLMLSVFIEQYQRTILGAVATSEVLLMPVAILGVLTGVCSLITPIIYGRFLSWRYASRRNPYTRNTFRQTRLTLDSLTSLPACPPLIRRGVVAGIDLVSRLAPVIPPAAN